MSDPSRILIVRLGAIGDIIMSQGLIASLKRRYPQAQIDWLTDVSNAGLLRFNPYLNAVVEVPFTQWKKRFKQGQRWATLKEIWAFGKTLKARQYDWVLDIQGLFKSGLFVWMSQAPRRIGIRSKEGSQFMMTEVIRPGIDEPEFGSEYRSLLEHLDCELLHYEQGPEPGPEAEAFIAQLRNQQEQQQEQQQERLEEQNQGHGRPVAVLFPFTTRPQKEWIEDRWVTLAKGLIQQGYTAWILGGPADREVASRIAQASGADNLAGSLSLNQSLAAIRQAQLAIGVDTGLTHAANTYRVPTLALFGSTRPYLFTDAPKTRVLYHRMDCSPCHRRPSCGGAYTCMKAHTAEDLLIQAKDLTEGGVSGLVRGASTSGAST